MTQSAKPVVVEQTGSEEDVERVNEFFNLRPIKRDLHQFTYRTTLDRAFTRDDRRLFYVEDDGDVVAALMMWCESRVLDADEAQIRLVAVKPEYRGRGIGQALCEAAEEFAVEYGESKMSADVMAESQAIEFWESLGYTVEKEWTTNNGRSMCLFSKAI
jgi:ribosomal protein S18 acetylase RimI-like enzyme